MSGSHVGEMSMALTQHVRRQREKKNKRMGVGEGAMRNIQ